MAEYFWDQDFEYLRPNDEVIDGESGWRGTKKEFDKTKAEKQQAALQGESLAAQELRALKEKLDVLGLNLDELMASKSADSKPAAAVKATSKPSAKKEPQVAGQGILAPETSNAESNTTLTEA